MITFIKRNPIHFLLISADILSIIFAFLSSYYLRDKGFFRIFLDQVQPLPIYITSLVVAIILLLSIFFFFGLYEPKTRLSTFSESYTAVKAITMWILFIMAYSYIVKFDYSRIIIFLLYIFSLITILSTRFFVRNIQKHFLNNGFGKTNVIIVGTGRYAKKLSLKIQEYTSVGLSFIGFVATHNKQTNTLGTIQSLSNLIKKHNIHEVYIADPTLTTEEILNLITRLPQRNTKFKIASDIFDLVGGGSDITNLEYIPSIDLSKNEFSLFKKVYKRIFDLIFGTIFFLITFPLWIILIILILTDSEGPALLTQDRIGLKGKKFKMYKFRTMKKDTNLYTLSPKNLDDKRITRIGKVLRKTSLDELPQLLNVIKGDMSIVGPRPEMPFIVKRYNSWQKRRLLVKPGLTGLWQILGRKDLPLTENLEYDFYYINNHSILLDIAIIIKTIPILLRGTGAY